MKLQKLHLQIVRKLDPSDRPVYLFSLFAFYFPIIFMIIVVFLKILDSLNILSAPVVYAAPPLSWGLFETVPGWAYLALLVIGINLHFKGLALIPRSQLTASVARYLYYYQHGWSIARQIWSHFKKYPEIKTFLIYLALFLGLVYLYNTL